MKCSIVMSIMLAFGLHLSSQCSHNDEEMHLLEGGKSTRNGKGLSWGEAKSYVYSYYDDSMSCQSCYYSMPKDRCTCVSCIGTGICSTLFTGCLVALSYLQYQHDQIQKCKAWCGRGYQGFGWCMPDQTCFSTLNDCENACVPPGDANNIGRYLSIGGLIVTGAVGVSMCCVPCKYLIKYCKDKFASKMRRPQALSNIEYKYRGRELELLDEDDIKNDAIGPALIFYEGFLFKLLNPEQRDALDSIRKVK